MAQHVQWCSTGFSDRPILFLIYINDLPTGIKSKIHIFADDTKRASNVDTVEDEEIVNDDLEAHQNLQTV